MSKLEFIMGLIFFILVSAFVVFEITLIVKYGNKPIDEIPFWVLWFLFPRGKG